MSVHGKIIAEEIEVKLANTWPDYVFEKDYQLISLEQVKKHIEAEKHLPGMPSAKEVEENGLALGEMQRLMMEKIEELFLHTIKLNEELLELKQANEELKSQIGK
ncbi:MAG: hypothetical protein H0X62_03210 [Bacteroidetes bacterium]|nr:hypothetical protein [Bacteroidota bacterium]